MTPVTERSATSPDATSDPEALAAALRLSVTRLARILRQQSDAGLTPTQLAALATLDRVGPMSIGALADEEQVGAPTATKIVDKLEAAGQVARAADATDRRITRVSVTPAGRALLADLRARKTAWLSARLSDLSAEQLATVADAVAVLDHLTAPPTQHRDPEP